MRTEFGIQGLDGLLKRMEALPKELVSKSGGPAKNALRKAANLVRDDAIANVNVSQIPGDVIHVKDFIVSQRDSNPRRSGASERYRVGVEGGARKKSGKNEPDTNPWYFRFLELGTEKMSAQPFLVPALERNVSACIDLIAKELDAGLTRIEKKLAKIK